jgi:hypothetical protein
MAGGAVQVQAFSWSLQCGTGPLQTVPCDAERVSVISQNYCGLYENEHKKI